MSNAIKSFVTSTVEEETRRINVALPSGAEPVVEAVADRVADHVEEKAKALVEKVADEYGPSAGDFATSALTEAGFISEPEPEVVATGENTPSDDEPIPAWAQALTAKVERLFSAARERGLNV